MSLKFLFKKYSYKIFNKLGLYVSRLKTPENTFHYLDRRPFNVQKQELKHLSYYLSVADDHKYYNELLKLYIPNWDMQNYNYQFIGEGQGGGALSAFRKVYFKKSIYFEKVFFTQSKDLEVIKWLDKHVRKQIKDKIKIPKIHKTFSGELLTIVYMDFLNLEPFGKQEVEKELIGLTKTLYLFNIDAFLSEEGQKIPKHLLDYTTNYLFQMNVNLVKRELEQKNIDYKALTSLVQNSKKVITHGDVIPRNVAKDNIIIDWDSFGFYPIGMDQAYLYQFLYLKENKQPFIEPIEWLTKHYKNFVMRKNWKQFELNFVFFLLIFSYRFYVDSKHLYIKEILLKRLSTEQKRKR